MNDYLSRIPVRDGRSLIHCDGNAGEASKNGVWRIARGSGWHGSTESSEQHFNTPGWRMDPQGIRVSTVGAGNVSRVGELLPKVQDPTIQCYHCVIN